MRTPAIILLIIGALSACTVKVDNITPSNTDVAIYPDYKNITIPENIAPINFSVTDSCRAEAVVFAAGSDTLAVSLSDGCTRIGIKQWQQFMSGKAGSNITVTICRTDNGKWIGYKPFSISVAPDRIDPYVAYRLIPPGYEIWNRMGTYQRNIETYTEKAIFENRYQRGNCANCHAFSQNNPNKMMLHVRSRYAGTYIFSPQSTQKLTADFSKLISNPTYPYWHPNGRFIAFSVNSINQDFHTADQNIIEVYDNKSDVIVYDLERNAVLKSPLTCADSAFETFPCFSPDGTRLYFCSAAAIDSVRRNTTKAKYNICSIAFDVESRSFGTEVDTVFSATAIGKSATMPRISPDGKFLMFTLIDYGQFPIWHTEADLRIIDLSNNTEIDATALNSPAADSYHSWCSNSRWVVFSSRRDDGMHTRLYIAHIDSLGRCTKPFLLPQENPRQYYNEQLNSYNIPEFITGEVQQSALETNKRIRNTK